MEYQTNQGRGSEGNRVWKQSFDGETTTRRKYIVDINSQLPVILCELDGDDPNILTSSYFYADAQILAQKRSDPPEDPNFAGPINFYVHDRLGSVRMVVVPSYDELTGTWSVNAANAYTYTPFGSFYEGQCVENIDNPFKFTGQWHDVEIDQYHLRARMYDPAMMRFTGRDPARGKYEEPRTLHKYLYCINIPTKYIDPSGEFHIPEILVNMAYTTATGAVSGGLGGFFYSFGYMMANPERFANMTEEEQMEWITDNVKSGVGMGAMAGLMAGLGGTEAVVQFLYTTPALAFPGGIAGGALIGFADSITDSLKGSKSVTRMQMRTAAKNATIEIICDTWF